MQNELINGRTPNKIKRGIRNMLEACVDPCGIGEICREICCSYDGDKCCHETILMDALALIEHLEYERDVALAKVPKWISIRERIPQDGRKIVMINEKYPSITLQGIYKADKTPDTIRVLGFGIGKVTHWMPMPEPPKEGE